MKPALLDRLACPWCRETALTVRAAIERGGEVESGTISCPCGARFPIDRFVPSFFDEHRMSDAERRMLADGEYWSGFYNYYADLGYRYFIDSRLEVAPLQRQPPRAASEFDGAAAGRDRPEHRVAEELTVVGLVPVHIPAPPPEADRPQDAMKKERRGAGRRPSARIRPARRSCGRSSTPWPKVSTPSSCTRRA